VGGAVSASVIIGLVVDTKGWDAGFMLIVGACLVATLLITLIWKAELRHRMPGE